ncbi:6-hydroxymethylpterin diphosphokinase MptE-like protein [Winogradskyella forsetii]|uniref:6-hydroxymethylpterin diphosphokinase MptE-like protein n=1 Tax=Winogradskyella forsetii TaxID=2686077 RepID=UPI0015B99618|nr:6-hydroxymethylpterin diphosphokinase MptE-like protein [Winogradskyella forsetii]
MFGRREEVAMSIINLVDNWRRDIKYYFNWLLNSDLRKEMAKNKALKNKHQGERCFIIGNGPSLKHYDLSKLTDDYVFTVNYMMKSESFKTLNPNCHLFFDPVVFGLDPEKQDDYEKIKLIEKTQHTHPDMNYVIPYRRRANFLKLFPNHKFIYVYNNKTFTSRQKNVSHLHRNIPGFQNVILYGINMAIYMGFKEIYLLGVDMTGFMEHFEYNKINDQFGHAYNETKEEREKISKILIENKLDNEFYLKAMGKTFEHFRLMKKNASDHNVKLLNASSYGGLDVLERVNYEKIFLDGTN